MFPSMLLYPMIGMIGFNLYYTHYFNGFDYPVVNGSKRDRLMKKALLAQRLGYEDVAHHWHLEAIQAPGCAHAHRMGVRHG